MKKTITLLVALVCNTIVLAQEAGSMGELLKNEASNKEINVKKREVYSESNSINQRNAPNTNNSRNTGRNSSQRYSWIQNYGYAELFLRTPELGYFTVEIDNQSIANNTGKFRFFDLKPGRVPISIYENGYLIYRNTLQIRDNRRLVLDFFVNHGLYLLDSYLISGKTYGFNEWDDIWNNPYANGNQGQGTNNSVNVMTKQAFDQYLIALKKVSFDRDRLELVQQQSKVALFTAQQIKSMLASFTFDEQRLEAGKVLSQRCVDIANFYLVYDAYTFDKNKRELMNYVSGRQ